MPTQLTGGGFDSTFIAERPGFISVLFEGHGAKQLFANEAGGHRWQRIPPTEKKGRVQTSTVTVAVLDPNVQSQFKLDESELEIQTTRGTGPGGQHRNKTDSCVVITHVPTKIRVRADMKSQKQSRQIALKIITAKLADNQREAEQKGRASIRRNQVGSGMRGDKIRTYRARDNLVVDNRTGQTWKLRKWIRGEW